MSRNRLSKRVFVRQELHNGAFVRRRALCDVSAALLVLEGRRKTRQPLCHGLPPFMRPGARRSPFDTHWLGALRLRPVRRTPFHAHGPGLGSGKRRAMNRDAALFACLSSQNHLRR